MPTAIHMEHGHLAVAEWLCQLQFVGDTHAANC
jgi:hypothetical protein